MKIIIPINAVAQERPRFKNGRCYDPPRSREFKREVGYLVKDAWKDTPMIEGTARLDVTFYRRTLNCDVDNLVKALMDALQGICYKNDSQIWELNAKKRISSTPRIELDISAMEADNENNTR